MSCARQRIGFCTTSAVDAGSAEGDLDMDSLNNYVESSITYMIDTEQSTKLSTMPSEKPVRYKPWMPEWINQILRTAELPRAVGHLRAWMPEK